MPEEAEFERHLIKLGTEPTQDRPAAAIGLGSADH